MSSPIAIIIARTAEAFGVAVADLTSERRGRSVVLARHIAMTLARQLTPASYPRIARAFRRDHTTVMAAEARTRARLAADPALAARVAGLRAALEEEIAR